MFLDLSAVTEEGNTAETPQAFTLYQNTPNPFNPGTAIRYELTQSQQISMRVYDLLGREVAVLDSGMKDTGYHEVYWNGRDANGISAASGVYLYRLKTGGYAETKRMMIVR
ncbi:MAG: T9SS type A sorting domain-containing protein [Candidatus Latescibacteria bacterium]|nr:T9SS type A sorting domain-containing protein [Candidatus Latescibacterota bacterium]